MKLLLSASLSLALVSTGASAGYVQQFVDAHGGCRDGIGTLDMLEDRVLNGRLLGKNVADWTDEDLEEYRQVYEACLRLHPAVVMTIFRFGEPIVAPPGAIEARVDTRMAEIMSTGINPARAARREEEASAVARQALADDAERSRTDALRKQAMQQEAAKDAQHKQERAREEARWTALQEQARKDREAADQARSLAEQEAPLIASIEKEAAEAHRARLAAEKNLEGVRQQVASAQNQRSAEDASTAQAKAKRLQVEQQDAQRQQDRREYEALAKTCSVSAAQFGRVALGMTLREVRQTFGCVGTLNSSTDIQGVGAFSVYQWNGSKGGTAAITTFNEGRLVTKAQNALE